MKMYPREFPSGRRKKAKRQAERRVYEALAGAAGQGFCYYEWRKGYERIELDFAVWIEGLGRFALQVKGGRYLLIDGEWYLKTRSGIKSVRSSPLDETKLSALDLHDDVMECARTSYNPYVIPVLIFPDMEPDPAIKGLAKRNGVYVIWGVGSLMTDLAEIVRSRRVSEALRMDRIAREVHAVTDGLICLGQSEKSLVADAADQPVSVSERRQCAGTLRLTVAGTTVLTIRSSAVRCRLGKGIRNGREPKR